MSKLPLIALTFVVVITAHSFAGTAAPAPAKKTFANKTVTAGKAKSHSYQVLKTRRDKQGRLHVIAEVWDISETGPQLLPSIRGTTLHIRRLARCGTVMNRTWRKIRLDKILTAKQEAQLNRISLQSHPKLLVIRK